nr:hypothetical protein [Sphingomonas sp. OV641]
MDLVARTNHAAALNDAHNPSLADQLVVRSTVEHGGEQARFEALYLGARVPQPGDFQPHIMTNEYQCMPWKREQIDAAGRYVLAEISGANAEALQCKLFEQLSMDKVNLSKVRLAWINRNPGAMLDHHPLMRVTFHAETGRDLDSRDSPLREPMSSVASNRHYPTVRHMPLCELF